MADEVVIDTDQDGRITVSIPYNPEYIAKLKKIKGYRWHPGSKFWSFPSDNGTLKEILEQFDRENVKVAWSLEHENSLEVISDIENQVLTIKQAADWASGYIGKRV